MNWIESISDAIDYIENNLTDDLVIINVAKQAYISQFYFQKTFSMLCGFTVGEYIRMRRLTLAASELISTDKKIVDIALKYGYDSPDSFTKAFTRFHGATPSAVRKNGALIKSFAPLKLKFTLEGGYTMNYKIIEKEAFTVVGASKKFSYETALAEIPKFWGEVCGKYGISIAENNDSKEFEYLIANNYNPLNEIPQDAKTFIIPAFTWAVFPCKGPGIDTIQSTTQKIFSEWLPNCKDYEIAGYYSIEYYSDPADFKAGILDNDYYAEIWIPVKKK